MRLARKSFRVMLRSFAAGGKERSWPTSEGVGKIEVKLELNRSESKVLIRSENTRSEQNNMG